MNKKTILITGDDGYNSLGTRVLIHFLKNDFNLAVVGTKKQQSGVGGFKSIQLTGAWGETTVDGVRALWIDGSPVDAVEAARQYFPCPFSYVIAGINFGVNVGGCLFSSGTFAAAFHSVNLGVAPKAIAISWDVPPSFQFKHHNSCDDLSPYFTYPGETTDHIIRKVMDKKLWGADIVNINFPKKQTTVAEFAQPLSGIHGLWSYIQLDKKTGLFSYGKRDYNKKLGGHDTDVQIIARNHIAITPCQSTCLDSKTYDKMSRL